ncbi:exodeoxyribonuclease V subunit beta [Desulfamplus magnetovallimortis]|uniref:exodeoxyribonuclease V subunit beta n=1 Tax=Desulfamplus magnetovallimortis TaxID=1246637 RepID=UPI0016468C16|nr:exodeoxyribonuclease V subunit beta [Desulfamplus magnetovallimortis]
MERPIETQHLDSIKLPLYGTRMIEASAGTGKTYTIAALYLRLILGHGGENAFSRPLTPPEILVVTFTNAATEELRDRIRSRLVEAASFFRNEVEGDPFLERLKADYSDDALLGKARLLDNAARWMDESAIHTIHAWCRRMLQQHAFDSGSLFDMKLENNDQGILHTASCDYWRTFFYDLDVEELNEILSQTGIKTPTELLNKVLPFIYHTSSGKKSASLQGTVPTQDETAPLNGEMEPLQTELKHEFDTMTPFAMAKYRLEAIKRAKDCLASDFSGAVSAIYGVLENKTINGNKYRKASLEKWIREIRNWVEDDGPLPQETSLLKFSASGIADGMKKGALPPEHPAFNAMEELLETFKATDIKSSLFLHASEFIRARVRYEKERLAMMGFDDLLTRFGSALKRDGADTLASLVRQQFPVAMIDEFQDTDPVQYESFRRIYGKSKSEKENFFLMIGDPKQAIYAFRGADIHTYLEARKESQGAVYTLDTNYRSTRGVVDAVNRIFGVASAYPEDYPEGAFLLKDKIVFEPVSAKGRDNIFFVKANPVKSITFWQMQQSIPVNKKDYIAAMAEGAADEIAKILNLASLDPPMAGFGTSSDDLVPLYQSDIAILVRNGEEAKYIRDALSKRGLRSVYLSDRDFVFDTQEASDLLYLIRACAEPSNAAFIRTALSASVLDCSFEWLETLNHDESAWEYELDRFREYQHIWQNQGILPMIRRILLDFKVPSRLLSRIDGERLLYSDGERTLTNLLHLSEILQSESSRVEGEKALVRWFSGELANANGKGDSEELVLRLESDEKLIKVITVHKSKGLEYPLVFLPFICTYREVTGRNASVIKYRDEEGIVHLSHNPDDEMLQKADRERLEEDMRMLYVALTRACHASFLGIGVIGKVSDKHGETSYLHLSGIGTLLSGGKILPLAGVTEALEKVAGDSVDIRIEKLPEIKNHFYNQRDISSDDLSPAEVFKGAISRQWWVSSYTGILRNSIVRESGQTQRKSVPDIMEYEMPFSPAEDQLLESETEAYETVDIQFHENPDVFYTQVSASDRFCENVHLFECDCEQPCTLIKNSPPFKDIKEYDLPDFPSICDFPRGPEPGIFLHDLLEWAAREGFDIVASDKEKLSEKIRDMSGRRGLEAWTDTLIIWITSVMNAPLMKNMKLGDLNTTVCQAEMEFMFAAKHVNTNMMDQLINMGLFPGFKRPALRDNDIHGMLKGFIDLVFFYHGKYYIMDYKSNYLGEHLDAYGMDSMLTAMLAHRYDLQYTIYTIALHRLLKARLKGYDYDSHAGGVIYLFLRGFNGRGQGVFFDRPPKDLVEKLSDSFAGK